MTMYEKRSLSCPICCSVDNKAILDIGKVPVTPFHSFGDGKSGLFGEFRLSECVSCGHYFNDKYSPELIDDQYGSAIVTNKIVSHGMMQSLNLIKEAIISAGADLESVLEIGGGYGALSIALSEYGNVDLVEPSSGLRKENFVGTRVRLIKSLFPSAATNGKTYTTIVCRQVLEHVPDATHFMRNIRSCCCANTLVYIEVPSFDFIAHNNSVIDLHYQHVNYFTEHRLKSFFAGLGFKVQKKITIKNGHDIGLFLSLDDSRHISIKRIQNSTI